MDDSNDTAPFPPTLRDVARHAKVSLATADRVVNRRAGVRPRTAERVEAAVRELGFERHAGAAALARRSGFRAVALLPGGANPFIEQLETELKAAARVEGLRRLGLTIVRTDGFEPASLAAAIDRAAAESDGLVVMGLDSALVAAAIDRASGADKAVVCLVSDVPGAARARYVGIDNQAAGRVAASMVGRFLEPTARGVLVVLGSHDLRDHRDRLEGFRQALETRFPALRILGVVEGQDDAAATDRALAAALAEHGAPDAVYSAGAGVAGVVSALRRLEPRPVVVAHELTPETRPLLESGRIDALIVQDPGHEARSAIRVLMATLGGTAISESQERIRIEILLSDNLPN